MKKAILLSKGHLVGVAAVGLVWVWLVACAWVGAALVSRAVAQDAAAFAPYLAATVFVWVFAFFVGRAMILAAIRAAAAWLSYRARATLRDLLPPISRDTSIGTARTISITYPNAKAHRHANLPSHSENRIDPLPINVNSPVLVLRPLATPAPGILPARVVTEDLVALSRPVPAAAKINGLAANILREEPCLKRSWGLRAAIESNAMENKFLNEPTVTQ
jgi:hypothetical protein